MKSQTLKRILIELDEDTSGDLDRSELRELVASIDPRDKTLGPWFEDVRTLMGRCGIKKSGRLSINELRKSLEGLAEAELQRVLKEVTAYKCRRKKLLKNVEGISIWIFGKNTMHVKSQYEIGKQFGLIGGFGTVFRGKRKEDGKPVAIKRMLKHKLYKNEILDCAIQEIKLMKKTCHPNVVQLFDYFEDHMYLYLVLELLEGGELFARIENYVGNEEEAACVIAQMLTAVSHLHSKGIAHCDIKPENFLFRAKERRIDAFDDVLRTKEEFKRAYRNKWESHWDHADIDERSLNESRQLVLIDFGIARRLGRFSDTLTGTRGTLYYMAPEVLEGEYKVHCDLWSIGVTMFAMLYGYFPFDYSLEDEDMEDDEYVFDSIRKGFQPVVKEGRGPWFNKHIQVSKEARNLIASLLTTSPCDRVSAGEALFSSWFAKTREAFAARRKMVERGLKMVQDMSTFRRFMLTVATEGHKKLLGPLEKITESINENKSELNESIAVMDVMRVLDGASSPPEEIRQPKQPSAQPGNTCIDGKRVNFLSKDGKRGTSRRIRGSFLKNRERSSIRQGPVTICSHKMESDKIPLKDLQLLFAYCSIIAKEERLQRLFQKLDTSGDGRIEWDEFKEALESAGLGSQGEFELKAAFRQADKDRDGRVDYDEFLHCFGVYNFKDILRPESLKTIPKVDIQDSFERASSHRSPKSPKSSPTKSGDLPYVSGINVLAAPTRPGADTTCLTCQTCPII
ncbi:hypothetical protein AAMO2058_000487800 [Amorphochlora amoebiformis]